MKKVAKGTVGYIRSEKKRRSLITAGFLGLTIALIVIGLLVMKTRLNWFTFAAILLWLPGAKFAVNMFMVLPQKPVAKAVYEQTEACAGKLERAYELVISAYEGFSALDAVVICGVHVVAYTTSPKIDCAFAEKHITKILKANGYKAEVKIFKDLTPYLERVKMLAQNQTELEKDLPFTPLASYPDLNRSQLVKHTILAISL